MYVKRNVAKRNPNKVVEATAQRTPNKVTEVTAQRTLKRTGLGDYSFPVYDEVPSGIYYSEIKEAIHTTTRAGDPTIEVFYKMKYGPTSWQIHIGKLPADTKNKAYFVKQSYPEGSKYYKEFVDKMADYLGKDDDEEFTVDDVKGISEVVMIGYETGSKFGGIQERYQTDWKTFLKGGTKGFNDDEDESVDEEASVEREENCRYEHDTEDDEFDDFFDGIDDEDDDW